MVVLLPESTELSSVLWTIAPKPRFSVPSGKLCLLLPTSSRPSLKPPDKTTENHERLWKPRFNINSEMNMIGHYNILIEPNPVYARAQIDKGFLNFLAKRSFHKFRRANRTQKRSPRLRDNSNHHRRPAAIVVAVKPMEMLDLIVVIHLLARSIPHPLVVPPSLRPHPDHDNVRPNLTTRIYSAEKSANRNFEGQTLSRFYSSQRLCFAGSVTFGTKPVSGTGAIPSDRRISSSSSQYEKMRLS